jgi:hypothetical protein
MRDNGRPGHDYVLAGIGHGERTAIDTFAHPAKPHRKARIVSIERPTTAVRAGNCKHRDLTARPAELITEIEPVCESYDYLDWLPRLRLGRRHAHAANRKALRARRPSRHKSAHRCDSRAQHESSTE